MPPTPPSSEQIRQIPPMQVPHKKSGAGATVGIIIIVLLMMVGGFYFWGARLNAQKTQGELPLIPNDASVQL